MANSLYIECLTVGPIATNCYLFRDGEDGREVVLVDPGDQPDRILRALKERGAVPSAILLTHGHFDHIMAVNEIRAAYPSCRVYIGAKERPMVENPSLNSHFFTGDYVIAPDTYVEDGGELQLLDRTFRVIATPGHTAGSVCYYSAEDAALFSGDTIFYESYGRYDLPTGNPADLRDSLFRILTTLPAETSVFPGHGPATTVAHEQMIEGYTD